MNYKSIFLLIALQLVLQSSFAQNISETWRSFDSITYSGVFESFNLAVKDNNGGAYVAGQINGEIHILHYNSTLNVIWDIESSLNSIEDDLVNDIILGQNGLLYICGNVYEYNTKKNIYIACIDTLGNFQWEQTWNNNLNRNDEAYAMSQLSNGNIAIVGKTEMSVNITKALMQIWSASGNLLSNQMYSGNSTSSTIEDIYYDVAISPSDDIIVCGQVRNLNTSYDGVLNCYNSSGNQILWNITGYDVSSNSDHFSKIVVTNGIIYIGGSSNVNAIFQSYSLTGTLIWSNSISLAKDVRKLIVSSTGDIYATIEYYISSMQDIRVAKLSSGGSLKWIYNYVPVSYNGSDYSYDLIEGFDSKIYVCGNTRISVTDATQILIKLDTSGTLLWEKQRHGNDGVSLGNTAAAIIIGSNTIGFIGAETNLISSIDATITLVDTTGNLINQITYSKNGGRLDHPALAVDNLGMIYSAGQKDNEISISKRDSDGNLLWETTFIDTNSIAAYPIKISFDSSNNVIIAGSINYLNSGNDILLLKYSPQGSFQWFQTYSSGGIHNDLAIDLKTAAADNILISGTITTQGTRTQAGLLNYDPSGNLNWTQFFTGTDTLASISSGGIAIDNGTIIYLTYSPNNLISDMDVAIAKLDLSGNVGWIQQWNDSLNANDRGNFIGLFSDHSIGVVGQSTNPATGYDIEVLRFDSTGALIWHRTFAGPSFYPDVPYDMVIRDTKLFFCGIVNINPTWFFAASVDINGTTQWQTSPFQSNTYSSSATGIDASTSNDIIAITGTYQESYSDIVTLFIDSTGTILDTVFTGSDSHDNGKDVIAVSSGFLVNGSLSYDISQGYYTQMGIILHYCPSPSVVFTSSLPDTICLLASPYTLSASPAGGVFWGNGVQGTTFDPSLAGQGNCSIFYTYTDPVYNCPNTISTSVFVDLCLSNPNILTDKTNWIAFPNPTDHGIYLQGSKEYNGPCKLTMTDGIGKFISKNNIYASGENIYLEIEGLENGIYFLSVEDTFSTTVIKIIVQR